MSDDPRFGKRRPPTELNYDDYRSGLGGASSDAQKGNITEREIEKDEIGRQCTQEEIAARKILKIRRGGKILDEDTVVQAENNSHFTINQPLPTNISKPEEQKNTTLSFLSNNNPTNTINEPKKESGGLFGNLGGNSLFATAKANTTPGTTNTNTTTSTGFFSNQVNTGLSLFNKDTSSSLFSTGNKNIEEKQYKQEEPPKSQTVSTGGLFGNLPAPTQNLFSNVEHNSGNSLFSGLNKQASPQPKKEEEKPAPSTGGLFGNLLNPSSGGSGLFSGLVEVNKTAKNTGTNIFTGNISSTFLKPQEQPQEDENAEEDEEENDEHETEEQIDKAKSTGQYKYDETTSSMLVKEVANFKVNEIQGYGKGRISIEKVKDSTSVLLIFRNPAKLIKYQGLLVKGISTCDYMKGKDEAIFIISYTIENKIDETSQVEKKTTVRNNCKMQFNGVDDAKDVLEYVKKEFSK